MLLGHDYDNVIPFDPLATRAQIDEQFRNAAEKFGEDHIKVIAIAPSWGEATPWATCRC